MENDEEKKKKLNDDVVVFLRKRSETEAPRYAARLHAYVDLQRKRSRAAGAKRRSSDHGHERKISAGRKKGDMEAKDKNAENTSSIPCSARKSYCGMSGEHVAGEEDRMSRRRGDKTGLGRGRSFSRSRSMQPSDACGRRRRRRRSCSRRRRRRRRSCRRRRRRRSCRRRRRRRSCGRRRRRRRRSCSRRRRRRSCRKRRRRRC